MSDIPSQENHQPDGTDPPLKDSHQPGTIHQATSQVNNANDGLILKNPGSQEGIENPEGSTSQDEKGIMTEIEAESKTQVTKTVSDDIIRSRQIYRKLQNKKLVWVPNDSELDYLKASFETNQNPSQTEKETLQQSLEQNLNTKVNTSQLGRWFQHQREEQSEAEGKDGKKSIYKKFTKEKLEYLQECFKKNKYPKIEEMMEVAQKLNSAVSKIENWYKHNRRSLAKKGLFKLKDKKYFKKEEVDYLQRNFALFPRPSKEKYVDIAKKLECEENHVKNWFSNRRKKAKKSGNRAQSMISKSNEPSNLQGRRADHKVNPYQPDSLIQNLPINMSKTAGGGSNQNQKESHQPIPSIYPGAAPLKIVPTDPSRAFEVNPYPLAPIYYVPQFTPSSTGLYSNHQPQFLPLNYNPQPSFTPFYIQPQGFQQPDVPIIYPMGPSAGQFPQMDISTRADTNSFQKEFQIQNIQSVMTTNPNHSSGTSIGSTSGNSGKNENHHHSNKDAGSSNTSKQDRDSKGNDSNSSKADNRPSDQDNFSNESPQEEPRGKLPKLKKFEISQRVEEQQSEKGGHRTNVFLEDKNQEASQPNQGRNLDLSKEYNNDQFPTALLTTNLHSGSNLPEIKFPGNQTVGLPWIGTPGRMLAPNFTSNPGIQPIFNHPIHLAPQNINPIGQMPYVVGIMYPYQNITTNYFPTFQTNSYSLNLPIAHNPTQSELPQQHMNLTQQSEGPNMQRNS